MIYTATDGKVYVNNSSGKFPCADGCKSAKHGLMKRKGIVPGVRCGHCGSHWIKLEGEIYPDPDPQGKGLPEGWDWQDNKPVRV